MKAVIETDDYLIETSGDLVFHVTEKWNKFRSDGPLSVMWRGGEWLAFWRMDGTQHGGRVKIEPIEVDQLLRQAVAIETGKVALDE